MKVVTEGLIEIAAVAVAHHRRNLIQRKAGAFHQRQRPFHPQFEKETGKRNPVLFIKHSGDVVGVIGKVFGQFLQCNRIVPTIHILKNFKLKFFELGTKERYNIAKGSRKTGKLKKKRYTGKIQASKFFTNAINSKRNEVFSSIDRLLSDSIKKINDKYKRQ